MTAVIRRRNGHREEYGDDGVDLADAYDADPDVDDLEGDDPEEPPRRRGRKANKKEGRRDTRRKRARSAKSLRRSKGALGTVADETRADLPRIELQTPLLARAIGFVLVFGVVAGVAALALTLGTRDAGEQARATAPSVDVASETGPSGWAELYVSEFLAAGQGTEYRLDRFLPAANRPTLMADPGSFYATAVSTVSAEEVADGYWSVVVAAHVLARNAEGAGYRPTGIRYYAVGAHELDSGDGWYSLTLPAEVAPLRQIATDEVHKAATEGSSTTFDEEATTAVGQMLSAYLTSAGELDRYVDPAAGLRRLEVPMRSTDGRPTTGAPFSAIDVTQVRLVADESDGGDGFLASAEVRAQPVHAPDQWQLLHYTLRLRRRADRWEVTELLPAVPVAERADSFSTISGSERSEE